MLHFESQPTVTSAPESAGVHVSFSKRGGVATMELSGELDMAAEPRFDDEVRAALAKAVEHLVIDLRAIDFIDSSGLLMLLKVDALSRQDGFRLWVVHDPANQPAAKVLKLTGLDKTLPLVDRPPDLPG
jgi:anti-anti-sigma factor